MQDYTLKDSPCWSICQHQKTEHMAASAAKEIWYIEYTTKIITKLRHNCRRVILGGVDYKGKFVSSTIKKISESIFYKETVLSVFHCVL